MANQPNDQPDGPPSQSRQSDSQNSQKMAHPRPEKRGVNLTTIRYLDESVTTLHTKMDSLMEMMRSQIAQNQQLATQVAQLAQSPRREPSPRRQPPLDDENDDLEMTGYRQLPHRERPLREMTSHREIKPENGRRSFALFAPADNPFNRQQSAYQYN